MNDVTPKEDVQMHTPEPVTPIQPIQPKKRIRPLFIAIPLVIIFLIGGFFVFRPKNSTTTPTQKTEEEQTEEETVKEVDSSIAVNLTSSKSKENTVVITAKGLSGKYESIGYELQYESGGVGKGVTSGSKPLDVSGQDAFEREIYLGTCSKNVCKPDTGVTKVDLVLEFTDSQGKKSQFSKSFDL